MDMKISLFVMTKKGYEVLKTFFKFSPSLIGNVIASTDSTLDYDYYSLIEKFCLQNEIKFYDRKYFEESNSCDLSIAVSWRWIIKSDNPVIVFHDSLLPKYRGFNPLVSALMNGESEIGVTSLYASEEYDRGDIIVSSSTKVTYPITISSAIDLIIKNYVDLSKKIGRILLTGNMPKATPQEEKKASYSVWRNDDDYFIDWSQSSQKIRRQIDSVGSPYKGASSYVNDFSTVVRIISAEEIEDVSIENRKTSIGKVIFIRDKKPIVVCGEGLLCLHDVLYNDGSKMLPLKKFRTKFL